MADAVGTAVGLWDLAVRVTKFINDLRHVQDDFISLRSEADCLRISLGALASDSCQNALYHYITNKQDRDLKQIVKNCRFNMMDLNTFIAKCAKLGDGSSIIVKKKRDFFKEIGKALGKGFTKYKFVMTDKQAFRDKLVLPTASINIFLTSMTHVGLVNMGRIMIRTGHGNLLPPGPGKGNNGGGNARNTAPVNDIDGWETVGRRIAFRDTAVKRSDLTASLEEELLGYALHLIRGGLPFHVKTGGTTGTKHKVTKTTSTSTRTRSRSRSTGPLGLGKGGRGQKYVMRKKSISKPLTEKVEIVEREWESGSESDRPGRPLLALPAPPSSSSSRKYVEIKPDDASGSEKGSDYDYHSGSERGHDHGARSARRAEHRRPSARYADPEEIKRGSTISPEEMRARRRDILQTVRDEQEAAYREVEEAEQSYRTMRAQTRMSRPSFPSRAEEEEYERVEEEYEKVEAENDLREFLAEQYGVFVEPLPVPREPIDNGTVKDIPPPNTNEHLEPISDSEVSDSPPTPPLPRSRTMSGRPTNDRLRAQTYRSPVTVLPTSTRYEPYPDPRGPSRYRPGSRPYPVYYDQPPHRVPEYDGYPPPIVVDEQRSTPRQYGHDAPIIVDEQHSPPLRHFGYAPPHHIHRRLSDDSELGMYEIRRPPRGPGPGPEPSHGQEATIIRVNDEVPKHSKRKSVLKHRPVVVEHPQRYTNETRLRHAESERSKTYSEDRYTSRRNEGAPEMSMRDRHRNIPSYVDPEGGHDTYMRGARANDDSDGSQDRIEIVRR